MRHPNSPSNSVACVALLALAACAPGASHKSALIIDDDALLDAEQQRRIALFHDLLLADYDIDYRVETTRKSRDIDAYAAARFAELGAGGRSDSERGLLLVIDPAADRLRLEVGYALEGTYTDAFIAYVEQRQMVPFFRSGRVADGILATTELIVSQAQAASAGAGLQSSIALAGSGGGGAATAARLNDGRERHPASGAVVAPTGRRPEDTLTAYFAAMQARSADPALPIYTAATQRMLADWVMTPAQMDNVVRTYRRCGPEPAIVDPGGRYAVIRYRIADRQCSPWFFEHVDGRWVLDLTMMQRTIRFGRDNSWHFAPGAEHRYGFAFEDWRFDARGFPLSGKN